MNSVLVTGGAGFAGSSLAIELRRRNPGMRVIAVDNLKRRGSEIRIAYLLDAGVDFLHGDIRCREDLAALPEFELLLDCSAEPSVHTQGTPDYVLNTNLVGTMNCLELVRQRRASILFLSTSRVYSMDKLNDIPFEETSQRFNWDGGYRCEGLGDNGISESFSISGPKSFYGTSKLASELLIGEYRHKYGVPALINRCGVLAGPWQMGKVEQGFVALWVARHYYRGRLEYIGYGGHGKQVRDVLHIDDLFDLVDGQISRPDLFDGRVYNVGGGPANSVSLRELTTACQEVTGNNIEITPRPETSDVDIRIYISDNEKVKRDLGWQPRRSVSDIVGDVHEWLITNEKSLRRILQ